MSKTKPAIVTVTKTRHATQPFTFKVNLSGVGPELKNDERYTRRATATRGARRMLRNAGHQGVRIEYVFVDKTKRAK